MSSNETTTYLSNHLQSKRYRTHETWENDPYTYRELRGLDEPIKQPIRERILEFILKHHSYHDEMCFFGLPSIFWKFEKMLEQNVMTPVKFIGVEKMYGKMEYGRRFMPGKHNHAFKEEFKIGSYEGAISTKATVFHAELQSFLNTGRASLGNKHDQWGRKYKCWTSCWLDTCSPVSNVWTALQRVDNFCLRQAPVVPFAFTFMVGRDTTELYEHMDNLFPNSSALDKRVNLINAVLNTRTFRSFELKEAWPYSSGVDGLSRMAVVLGLLKLK